MRCAEVLSSKPVVEKSTHCHSLPAPQRVRGSRSSLFEHYINAKLGDVSQMTDVTFLSPPPSGWSWWRLCTSVSDACGCTGEGRVGPNNIIKNSKPVCLCFEFLLTERWTWGGVGAKAAVLSSLPKGCIFDGLTVGLVQYYKQYVQREVGKTARVRTIQLFLTEQKERTVSWNGKSLLEGLLFINQKKNHHNDYWWWLAALPHN